MRDDRIYRQPPPSHPRDGVDVPSASARLAVVPLALLMAAQILAKDYYQVKGEETYARSMCLHSKPLFHLTLI